MHGHYIIYSKMLRKSLGSVRIYTKLGLIIHTSTHLSSSIMLTSFKNILRLCLKITGTNPSSTKSSSPTAGLEKRERDGRRGYGFGEEGERWEERIWVWRRGREMGGEDMGLEKRERDGRRGYGFGEEGERWEERIWVWRRGREMGGEDMGLEKRERDGEERI